LDAARSASLGWPHQAIRLGYLPRVLTRHTSSEVEGQIYVPLANWGLAIACITLVLLFQESSKLAAAFGLAVSGTMGITSAVFFYVTWKVWAWPRWRSALLLVALLCLDLPFFAATCLKFFDGGYLPFLLGAGLFVIMTTFFAGRALLSEHLAASGAAIPDFLAEIKRSPPVRLPGLGVVMTAHGSGIPAVLMRMTRRFRVLHEYVFVLTANTEAAPFVEPEARLRVEPLGDGLFRVIVCYGDMEDPVIASAGTRVDL